MSDQTHATGTTLTIPPDTQAQFPELITLIQGSESMNTEERQYWVNILPVMTPEQRSNLQEILVNEKEQLAAIDAKYAEKMKETKKQSVTVEETGKRIRETKQKRDSQESAAESAEQIEESSILDQIKSM